MIIEKILEYKKSKIKNYPIHTNRASETGHPCLRYLVLNRTSWQEKTLPDLNLKLIYDEGNIHEAAVLKDLVEAGIRVVEQQRPFSWPKFELTGWIDAKVQIDESLTIPIEIKSMSPYIFGSVNSSDDMMRGKYIYLRKYPAQLQLYMLMDNTEESLMICKNKVNGQLKEISFKLNYEYAESILKRIEEVNAHVRAGTAPEAEWQDDACPDCGFVHICHPAREATELQMVEDSELEAKLNRRAELLYAVEEWKALEEDIKEVVKGKEKLVIGEWLITGKWIENRGGVKEVKPYKYWQSKIQKL